MVFPEIQDQEDRPDRQVKEDFQELRVNQEPRAALGLPDNQVEADNEDSQDLPVPVVPRDNRVTEAHLDNLDPEENPVPAGHQALTEPQDLEDLQANQVKLVNLEREEVKDQQVCNSFPDCSAVHNNQRLTSLTH